MATTQLKKFNRITKKIQNSARQLNKAIGQFKWILPPIEPEGISSVFHFYRFGLNPEYFQYKDVGKFRRAIQDALNAEGLNVRHYQKTPLSGQPFFQQKQINRMLPWSLNKKNYKYTINEYPNTLMVINSTLVLGAISSSVGYLFCPKTIEKYIEGFKKIEQNLGDLLKYADKIKNPEPWKEVAVISDSYNAKYEINC
ncbi:hypothetical protein KAJ89_05275 [Candidatus Parcubacteria bacterium]|nr:hypothetical protein [Candidatus Parcubacteria bacterium]